tara:strand:- start:376 stop:567 length:192 start_codon:yes stop_codon:yes gene_type:complete
MYDDIISNAKTAYSSKTGNKTKAIKDLLYVVGMLQSDIQALKSPAKPAVKKSSAKKSSAKKNV